MKFFYVLLFISFLLIGFVLSILNSAPIKINYYYGWLEMPLSFVILVTFITGILIGYMVNTWSNMRLRRRYSALLKKASLSKKEVSNLRTLAIK